ncbi:MAG: hypothetical protein IH597_13040 [Bacteroidales bacterium]|nr:hypothetical protein [Bacteroidales bacterium]
MKTKKFFKVFTVLALCLFAFTSANSQTRISSPYSRFGIGDLHLYNHTSIMAMGGTSIGLNNPLLVNFNNPASYHSIEPKSFVFEASLYNKYARLRTETLSQRSNYATLGHLLMAFPVTSYWKSSLGLLPFSDMGYKVVDSRIDEQFGKTEHNFEGSGGIHQFYWGNSVGIGKRLSVGFNLVYLFGTLEKNRSLSFPDSVFMLGTRILNTTSVSDLKLNTGIQYNQALNDDYSFTLGLTYSPEAKITIKDKVLAYNYFPGLTGVDNIRDTIIDTPSLKGKMVLPSDLGAGIMFQKTGRWLIAADYTWQNWENYTLFDRSDSLKNSMGVSLGTQFTPINTTISPYWKKMRYRFGIRYSQTYLELNNNQLNEFGISFGFGLPLSRTRSAINLGIEIGQRGTTKNNLIEETFFRFSASFSILDRWFEQRRYF